MDPIRNSSIRVFGGAPRSGYKKEMKKTYATASSGSQTSLGIANNNSSKDNKEEWNGTVLSAVEKEEKKVVELGHPPFDITNSSEFSDSCKFIEAAKHSVQEHDTNDTFGEDDMKDESALNSTFGEDYVEDESTLNSTRSTSAMEVIDDIEEDGCSQQSESSLRVLCRVIASGLFGFPVDTVSMCRCCGADDKHCLPPNEEVIGTSMNDISQVTNESYSSDLTLTFASDKAKVTGVADVCCGVFSQWFSDY